MADMKLRREKSHIGNINQVQVKPLFERSHAFDVRVGCESTGHHTLQILIISHRVVLKLTSILVQCTILQEWGSQLTPGRHHFRYFRGHPKSAFLPKVRSYVKISIVQSL